MFKWLKSIFTGRCVHCGAKKVTHSYNGLFVSSICPYCEMGPSDSDMTYQESDQKLGIERDKEIFP